MPNSSELTDSILELTDGEALRAANYVATWMQEQLKDRQLLPPELQSDVTDDQAAELLAQAFPHLSGEFQQTGLAASEAERGNVARNLLLMLASEDEYAGKVGEAIDQLSYKFDPITMMAVAALLVFVLSIKFDVGYDRKNGFRMHASKGASSEATIQKVLSFGAAPGPAAES